MREEHQQQKDKVHFWDGVNRPYMFMWIIYTPVTDASDRLMALVAFHDHPTDRQTDTPRHREIRHTYRHKKYNNQIYIRGIS